MIKPYRQSVRLRNGDPGMAPLNSGKHANPLVPSVFSRIGSVPAAPDDWPKKKRRTNRRFD
jgi:hypothetical protein